MSLSYPFFPPVAVVETIALIIRLLEQLVLKELRNRFSQVPDLG
ncbi:MAG: hypothetical protein OEQ18_00300 [Gammaproteobacteria bacterium]|nr:hypothetical protein [Gammaproteobacteria bacterium]